MNPADDLPLAPHITPALSVAGVLLMVSGLAYCFVGNKRSWIQISISSAYLVALAITVLILYIVDPPISTALQGAYLVAIAGPALVLAALACIFKEVAQGFGCAVGGFATSMFMLVLRPGGLLESTTQKSIFIGCWTLGVYVLAFSHYTRTYALIGSSAIGGATAVILGIDCFSLAGLKEFWIYVWGLNSTLFPSGTRTYPITKGMRVEIAAIVILSLLGILSQIKIWNIVSNRKELQKKQRLNAERQQDDLEAELGRRVEITCADDDRQQWEALYGGRAPTKPSSDAQVAVIPLDSVLGAAETSRDASIEAFGLREHSLVATARTSLLHEDTDHPQSSTEPAEFPTDTGAHASPQVDAKWPFSSLNSIDGSHRISQDGPHRWSSTSRHSLSRPTATPEQTPLAPCSTSRMRHMEEEQSAERPISYGYCGDYEQPEPMSYHSNRLSHATILSIEALAENSFSEECLSMLSDHGAEKYIAPSAVLEEPRKEESVDSSDTLPAASIPTAHSHSHSDTPASTLPDYDPILNIKHPVAHDEQSEPAQISESEPTALVPEVPLRNKTSLQSLKNDIPQNSSPIVQRFRTNEWAKHLSLADLPEPDPIRLVGNCDSTDDIGTDDNEGDDSNDDAHAHEKALPLDIKALSQTPLTAEPEPEMHPSVISTAIATATVPVAERKLAGETSSAEKTFAKKFRPIQYTPGGRPIPSFEHASYGPPANTKRSAARSSTLAVPSLSSSPHSITRRRNELDRRASAPTLPLPPLPHSLPPPTPRQSSRRSHRVQAMSPVLNSPISENEEMSFHSLSPALSPSTSPSQLLPSMTSPHSADPLIAERQKMLQHRYLTASSRRGFQQTPVSFSRALRYISSQALQHDSDVGNAQPQPMRKQSNTSLATMSSMYSQNSDSSSTYSHYSNAQSHNRNVQSNKGDMNSCNPTSHAQDGSLDENQPLSARRQQLKQQQQQQQQQHNTQKANMPTGPKQTPLRSATYPPQPPPGPSMAGSASAMATSTSRADQSLRRRTMLAHWHSCLSAEVAQRALASPWTADAGGDANAYAQAYANGNPCAHGYANDSSPHWRASRRSLPSLPSTPPSQPWRERLTKNGQRGWGTQGEAQSLAGLGGARQVDSAHREVMRRMQGAANRRLKEVEGTV